MRIGLAAASMLSFAAGSIYVLSGVGGILESWEAREVFDRYNGQPPLQGMSFDGPSPLTLEIFLDCAKWAMAGFALVASSIGVWRSPHRVWGWMMITPLAWFVVLRSVDLWLLTVHSEG